MLKEKKPKKWVRQPLMLSKLKGLFLRSPIYKAVKDAAKVPYQAHNKDGTPSKAKRFQYRCAHCKELFFDRKTGRVKTLQVDHIQPVIDPNTGFVDINTWVDRQFVGVEVWTPGVNTYEDVKERLQLLCNVCHSKKSEAENKIRRSKK